MFSDFTFFVVKLISWRCLPKEIITEDFVPSFTLDLVGKGTESNFKKNIDDYVLNLFPFHVNYVTIF